MISRVAESCFWLNRYLERAESLARMLEVNLAFQLDVDLPDAQRWRPLVVVAGEEARFLACTAPPDRDGGDVVQDFLTWNEDSASSIFSSLHYARENARTIRETISLEMWESLNELWIWLADRAAKRAYRDERSAFYRRVRNECLLFHGVAQATMLHEDPFEFMRLGTAIERVNQTARILDIKYHSIGPTDERRTEAPVETAQWLATLRFCAGIEPFLKRQDDSLSGVAVSRFLLLDRTFPRSVLHNLLRAKNFLNLVRPSRDSSVGARSDELVTRMLDELEAMSIEAVLERGLHTVLTGIVDGMAEVGEALHKDFFDPAPRPKSGPPGPPNADA